ncbi:MAG: hypothetical protein M1814_002427 [Vezdaea aestivalis]|nr:MAG: hypothetical protein M1814_002427 [Vezdaea aestivalis]
MDSLQLKQRHTQEEVECWDDDADFQADNDFHFRTPSIATTATSSHSPHQRDSIASRLSITSDFEPSQADEGLHAGLITDDSNAAHNAIASAIRAGIPIPKDTPPSALIGGSIRRLGTKKSRKAIGEVWGEDLELPSFDGTLTIKKHDGASFPDTLRQVSGELSGTQNPQKPLTFAERMGVSPSKTTTSNLDKYRDDEDADDVFGDLSSPSNTETIKFKKSSPKRNIPLVTNSLFRGKVDSTDEDFTADLAIPEDGELKLSARKDLLRTPAASQDDFEEWAEGSLGTRHGGTRRERQSTRSSSSCAMSPSIASSYAIESEDEGLDGLVLPAGPFNFKDMLSKRRQSMSPEPAESSKAIQSANDQDDFLTGLDIGDGDVFDSGKRTLNRNIKQKFTSSKSATRQAAMTITFHQNPPLTRLPRPRSGHDRGSGSKLESVAEASDAAPHPPRPHSRFGAPAVAANSPSSIPVPTTLSVSIEPPSPSTPSRRQGLSSRPSLKTLRPEPTTTSAQLLKAKRSMPSMRTAHSPAKVYTSSQRPPSRQDAFNRTNIPSRPKTPTSRADAEASQSSTRKPPVPFLPAGTSQSHHVGARTNRTFRRHELESSIGSTDQRSNSRMALSRNAMRSPSPKRKDVAPAALARVAASKRQMFRPHGRKNFGDGTELEIFDDLPTSVANESKFIRQPVSRGPPRTLRSRIGQTLPDRSTTPAPTAYHTPLSPGRPDLTPRFARDTNASRAREQRIGSASTTTSHNSRAPLPNRTPLNSSPTSIRTKRRAGLSDKPRKPQLIKPLGDSHQNSKCKLSHPGQAQFLPVPTNTPKAIKGMHYNPELFRWEGNENALTPFDTPTHRTHSTSPVRPLLSPLTGTAKQVRPLIHHSGTTQGVQVSGGMVFDPVKFRWLKLSQHQRQQQQQSQSHHRQRSQRSQTSGSNPLSPVTGLTTDDDSDDPFAGLEDLEEERSTALGSASRPGTAAGETKAGSLAVDEDEWLVGEEFDVGPEFIRRQRVEEARWKENVDRWIMSKEELEGEGGRGDIRELIRAGVFF